MWMVYAEKEKSFPKTEALKKPWKWQKKIYQSMELHMDAAIDKVQNLAMDVQVYEMEKTRKELYDKSHDGLERVQGEIAPVVAEQKHEYKVDVRPISKGRSR